MTVDQLAADPRVTVRHPGAPDVEGDAVVYWMQRAQRAWDNPALDVAIALGNTLRKPVVTFFGVAPSVRGATLRHYHFMAEGLDDIAAGLAERRVGLVLRAHPDHLLMPFLDQVRPVLLVGDENPLRQMDQWRDQITEAIRVPFWTVDADVVVPTQLLETEQYAARTIRPRIHKHLDAFLVESPEPVATRAWKPRTMPMSASPSVDILDGLPLDRSVGPVDGFRGGTTQARRRLRAFVNEGLASYNTMETIPK